jgi:hypothetical protein
MQRKNIGICCLRAKVGAYIDEPRSQMATIEGKGSNIGLMLGAR